VTEMLINMKIGSGVHHTDCLQLLCMHEQVPSVYLHSADKISLQFHHSLHSSSLLSLPDCLHAVPLYKYKHQHCWHVLCV
jgi:hypothetical protein